MPSTSLLAILVIGVSIAAVVGLWMKSRWHRRTSFDKRADVAPESHFRTELVQIGIDEKSFLSAWALVARAYRVAPEKLRLNDRFDGDLAQLDLHNLGEGKHDLLEALRSETDSSGAAALYTVKDFVIYYCQHQRKRIP